MSIELYLAINFVADCALLGTVGRILGLFDLRRVLLASALSTTWGALAASVPMPWGSPPLLTCLALMAAMILGQGCSARMRLTTALSLICMSMLCGGVCLLMSFRGPLGAVTGVFAGAALSIPLFSAQPPSARSWQICLRLSGRGKVVRFPALIDTGNRLREPISGLPVVIVEASLIQSLLPERGYRVLSYGALGGQGRLACFKPERLCIERRGRLCRSPEAWVAVAPGHLPGIYRALAPPEFACCDH